MQQDIRITRADNSVLILSPVEGRPNCFTTKFEDGSEYHFGKRIEALIEERVAASQNL